MNNRNLLGAFRGTGKLVHFEFFLSAFVQPRHVDIWLPEGYEKSEKRFPVIYMHDGQNLFNPETSYIGIDWGVDQAIKSLSIDENFTPPIVAGIWNTSKRYLEYMPQKALELDENQEQLDNFVHEFGGKPISDRYLKFVIKELKPFIDATYKTMPDRNHTFMMGSSIGGLISLYALCEYPDIFGGVASLSTLWSIGGGCFLKYLKNNVPSPENHRVYFDLGTDSIDSGNSLVQKEVDLMFLSSGYDPAENFLTKVYEGGEHSEKSWRNRVSIPLQFLLS